MDRKDAKLEYVANIQAVQTRRSSVLVGTYWVTEESPKSLKQIWDEADDTLKCPLSTFKWRLRHKDISLDEALYS